MMQEISRVSQDELSFQCFWLSIDENDSTLSLAPDVGISGNYKNI